MARLTSRQRDLLNAIDDKKNHEADGSYFCECGTDKPWNVEILRALRKKGFIIIVGDSDITWHPNGKYYLIRQKKD